MTERNCMVTLVHGTWARKAPWTQEGSLLSNRLKENGYTVKSSEWKSWNRFSARRDGANKLRTHLEEFADYDHFIIAHSHGGNVAIRAIDGDESLLKGAVCLNTPFFNIQSRDPQIFKSILMYLSIAASMIPIGLVLIQGWTWFAPLLYLAICIAAGVAHAAFDQIYAYIQNKGKQFHFKPLHTTPMYCLNTADDEAFGVLAFLSSVQNMLFLTVSRVVIHSKVLGIVIGGLLIIELLPFLHLPWDLVTGNGYYTRELFSLDEYAFDKGGLTWVVVIFKLMLLYVMQLFYYAGIYAGVVFSILIVLSTLVAFSQGFFAPLSGLFNRLIVSLKPLGSTNAEFREFAGDATEMRHSSLYDSEEVVENIVQWINSKN